MISGSSHVTAAGPVELTAVDQSQIFSLGISVAGSGAVAAGALIGANVITSTVAAEISGSTVESGSTLNLAAENKSSILGFTAGVAASGAGAGLLSLSANVIANTTRAVIVNGSDVDATGAVTLSAKDTSTIDALAFGVAASGGAALGAAVAANVITNTVETAIVGSILIQDRPSAWIPSPRPSSGRW